MYSFSEFCKKKNYTSLLKEIFETANTPELLSYACLETSSLLEEMMGNNPNKIEELIHLQEILKTLAGAAGSVLGGLQKTGAAIGRSYRKGRYTPHQRAINVIDTVGGALANLGYLNNEDGQQMLRYLQDLRLKIEKQSGTTATTYQGGEGEEQQQPQPQPQPQVGS